VKVHTIQAFASTKLKMLQYEKQTIRIYFLFDFIHYVPPLGNIAPFLTRDQTKAIKKREYNILECEAINMGSSMDILMVCRRGIAYRGLHIHTFKEY